MRCPICHQDVPWVGNPFRPFCTERCKLIDLDHWLSERYRISTPEESREKNSPAGQMPQDDKRGSG
ncbi:MAG TPA: DNA gyrase inhibitor YacG [Terriglobia bacterium]|nr:DNA gyrase inhibitor YacG [Terriglobia bacterium]